MIKHHLSIYFIYIYIYIYLIFTVFRCLKTSIKSSKIAIDLPNISLLKLFSQNTRNGVSGGACRRTPPLTARFLPLEANTSFLINKKGWTVCLSPEIPFLGI